MDLTKLTDELPRTQRRNPHNYTDAEWAKRDRWVKDLEDRYPSVPSMMLELLVDNTFRKTPDELDELIESKKWEEPTEATQTRLTGGVWTEGCEIVDGDEK
jgi:hypothetical protein